LNKWHTGSGGRRIGDIFGVLEGRNKNHWRVRQWKEIGKLMNEEIAYQRLRIEI